MTFPLRVVYGHCQLLSMNFEKPATNIVKKKFSAREVESLIKQKKTFKKSERTEDPNITFVQNEIESKLGMSVQIINKKNNSGKLIINYSSLDQFELLSKKLRK